MSLPQPGMPARPPCAARPDRWEFSSLTFPPSRIARGTAAFNTSLRSKQLVESSDYSFAEMTGRQRKTLGLRVSFESFLVDIFLWPFLCEQLDRERPVLAAVSTRPRYLRDGTQQKTYFGCWVSDISLSSRLRSSACPSPNHVAKRPQEFCTVRATSHLRHLCTSTWCGATHQRTTHNAIRSHHPSLFLDCRRAVQSLVCGQPRHPDTQE